MDNNIIQSFKNGISVEKVLQELCLDYDINGEDAVLLCPFHDEQTASFHINIESGLHNCFGCGQKGADIIAFVSSYKKLGFVQSLELLSELTGVPLPKNIEEIDKGNLVKRKLLHMKLGYVADPINIDFTSIYEHLLSLCSKDKAVEYLQRRGIDNSSEVADKMNIRVLDDYERINNEMLKKFSGRRLEQSGIMSERKNLIFFSHRLLLPFKHEDNIGYLSSRALDNETKPKYLNLSDITIPTFYNVNDVLNNDTIFVAEGQIDTITLVGLGLPVVGIAGATNIDIKTLEILSDKNVILVFDNDSAGKKGQAKLLEILKYIANTVSIYIFMDGKDINEHLQFKDNNIKIRDFYNEIRTSHINR